LINYMGSLINIKLDLDSEYWNYSMTQDMLAYWN